MKDRRNNIRQKVAQEKETFPSCVFSVLSNISSEELFHKAISLISSAFVTATKYFLFAGIKIHPALDGHVWKLYVVAKLNSKTQADLQNEIL